MIDNFLLLRTKVQIRTYIIYFLNFDINSFVKLKFVRL